MESLIFGGSGFIGKHLSNVLNSNFINLDLTPSSKNFKYCDIRKPVNLEIDHQIDTIFNFAAIHTTPGHDYHEYFETNIRGAENICNFARDEKINTIVFTSSIAPYGTWENEMTENSLPLPNSAYGISKFVAEEIHKRWQAEKPNLRKLIILRPGVVFGCGEKGNFTRLFNAMKKSRFMYPGRRDTKKSAIYVKDLVYLMLEMVEKEKPGVHLYNMVYTPNHTIENICKSVAKVANLKEPKILIPSWLLKIAAFIINSLGKIIGKSFDGIHPDRVKKLMISTDINGKKIIENGYKFKFSLESAIQDWYMDCNKKGLY